MTHNDQLYIFKKITNEQDDVISRYYLDSAKSIVIKRAYPFESDITELPSEYAQVTLDIAIFLYGKAGIEGQISSSENGITRTYEGGEVPTAMLKRVIPFCGAVK